MIKVSIIVPVYKVPLEYLHACLNSLVSQSIHDCEFIVVSDGAPEAEYSVCEEYSQKDARFKIVKREHAGVSAARNYGIKLAQGEYVTFVDSDDIIQENAIELWYKHAKNWDSDILATNLAEISFDHDNYEKILWQSQSKAFINKLEKESILQEFVHLKEKSIPRGACGKLYSHQFLLDNNTLFDSELKIGEDLFFNLLCFNKATNISYLPTISYLYRANPYSATRAFNPNFFYDHFAPILKIQQYFPNKYNELLGREALDIFYLSWEHCYMHPHNPESLCNRIKKLKQIIDSVIFQKTIANTNTKGMRPFIKFELFLFKKKIFFPVWLHAIKKNILTKRCH